MNFKYRFINRKIKKQWTIAISQFILHLLVSIFLIVVVSSANNNTSLSIVSSALLLISLIVLFSLWILGIVNATNINGITHNSIALIIFAIFPMWFVHWIFAAIELNKYDPNRAFNLYVPPHLNMNMNNMNCPNSQIKQNKKEN